MAEDRELSCREAARLLSLAFERELSAQEAASLRHHLGECGMCRNYEAQLKFLHEASRRFGR